ncbi:MAG: hypothetical protein RR922_04160 [Clostridia bacterium]
MLEKEREKQRLERKRIKSKFSVLNVIFLGVLIYGIVTLIQQEFMLTQYEDSIAMHKQYIADEQENLNNNKREKEQEKNDKTMERLARNLGYVKPSEKLFIDINK